MRWRVLMTLSAIGLCSTLWWCFTHDHRVAAAERRLPPREVIDPAASATGTRYVTVPLAPAAQSSAPSVDEPLSPGQRVTVQEEREHFVAPIKASGRVRGPWAADAHNQFSDLRRKFESDGVSFSPDECFGEGCVAKVRFANQAAYDATRSNLADTTHLGWPGPMIVTGPERQSDGSIENTIILSAPKEGP